MAFRIAIADDDLASSRPSYERLLADKAFDKPKYIDTLNEFKLCRFESFDALLLDVNLDEWDDFTLAEAVQLVGKSCPVVLVSGKWDTDGRTEDRIRQVMPLAKDTEFIQVLILNDLSDDGWERRLFAIRSQLKLAVARHRRQGVLDLEGGDDIYILHLSDPQYGDQGQDGWACMSEVEIAKFVKQVAPEIHFLAITGDITFDGKPSDFETAKNKIDQVLKTFLPNDEDRHERLLLVPGNHDVNLQLAAADRVAYDFDTKEIASKKSSDDSEFRRFALQPFRNFAWELTKDERWVSEPDLSWYSDSFRHLGLRFLFLNSVANLDCDNPSMANIGKNTTDTFSYAALAGDKLFGIALSHHGRESFQSTSIEALAQVSKIIQTCDIKLWLHGHGHKRIVERLTISDKHRATPPSGALGSDEVIRVMAPTTHLKEGKKLRPIGERRGFNVIKLERNDHHVRKVTVTTYRMSDEQTEQTESKVEINISF